VSPVTALTSDRRFRRAQVKPVRRRGKWYALARRAVQFAALAAVLAYGVSRAPAIAARAMIAAWHVRGHDAGGSGRWRARFSSTG